MDDYLDPEHAKQEAQQAGRGLMRTLFQPWLDRASLADWYGRAFHGRRDYYKALGYSRYLGPKHYRSRYDRGGIAATIVDTWPEETWGGEWEIWEDDDPTKDTQFELAWQQLSERLGIPAQLERLDKLAGLGRYAVMVIGAPGNTDTALLRCKPDDIKYLQPYSEDEAPIVTWDTDDKSERFAFPTMYAIRRRAQAQLNANFPTGQLQYHWTRVLHIADGKLDDPIFGASRLEKPWNRLDDLDKVIGGGSEAYWRRADGGTVFNVDKDLVIDPDPSKVEQRKEEMKKKFDEFTHEMEKNLVVRGVAVNRLGSDVADLRGPAAAIMDQIAGITKIPQRVLLGSEMGRLASTQDKGSFDDRVEARRKGYATIEVLRPFITHLIELGVLPKPKQWRVRWPDTDELDQMQRVTAAMNVTTVNKNSGQIVVTPSEIRTVYLGLETMTNDQLKEVDQIKQEKQAAMLAQQQQQLPQPALPPRRPPRALPPAARDALAAIGVDVDDYEFESEEVTA